jgi:hypothetical protein
MGHRFWTHGRVAVVAVTALTVASAPRLDAQAYWVSASGFARGQTGVLGGTHWDYVGGSPGGTGKLMQQSYGISADGSVTSTPCTQVFTAPGVPSCLPSTVATSATLSGSVAPGTIHISATSDASTSGGPFTDYLGNTITPSFSGEGKTQLGLQWGDAITFSGLPVGTPISVVFSMALDGTLGAASADGSTGQTTADFFAYLNNPVAALSTGGEAGYATPSGTDQIGFPAGSYTAAGTVYSGQTYALSGGVSLATRAFAQSPNDPSASAYIDASNTVQNFIQVLTPGATFTSASGALYTQVTTTPEPATVQLTASGLLLLGGVVKIRRRR